MTWRTGDEMLSARYSQYAWAGDSGGLTERLSKEPRDLMEKKSTKETRSGGKKHDCRVTTEEAKGLWSSIFGVRKTESVMQSFCNFYEEVRSRIL